MQATISALNINSGPCTKMMTESRISIPTTYHVLIWVIILAVCPLATLALAPRSSGTKSGSNT
eukprot:927085-Pelagomonas_calceolata.AAC.1